MCASYEIAKIIGVEQMIKLQSSLSGWHYIAQEPSVDNQIRQVIGYKLAKRLGKYFATERVWIGKGYLKADRNAKISAGYIAGYSTGQLAEEFGMTPRQVRNIVN